LFLDVSADVVDEGGLRVGLGGVGLFSAESLGVGGLGDGVERHLDVLPVADLVKFDVGDFLVADYGGVVSDNVARKFREVGSHND
jgi:hypothetical protein